MATTQSLSNGSNPCRKIRVIAKIRGFSDPDTDLGTSRTVDWVTVNTENSGDVTISFKEQSSSRYSVDYCYKEHEDNEIIYSREVKPLVSAAFEGFNSTVVAHGARGSGKTHLIQGSSEKPGLAVLATSDFLSMAEKNGKSIAVSFYEVDHQERAVDLLNPEQAPISVLEDHGKILFKGLAQTPVKSIAEFQKLYITACSSHKAALKKGFECARRSHMGLTVHVFSQNETLVSKMNFVDMAGYEDARRKSSDASGHVENKQINKSIHTVLNVCHALSTNESRVPFRESKLTRILQDSLRGTSKILLVSCLNPLFCQDTVYMVSLASRSCQWINQTPLDSTKKTANSTRQATILDSTKKSKSSVRQIVSSNSSMAREKAKNDLLIETKHSRNPVKLEKAKDGLQFETRLSRNLVRPEKDKGDLQFKTSLSTLDSKKKSTSSVRQIVVSDSSKKSSSSVRQTVTLDSTKRSASSVRQTVASDSSKKSVSSVRQTVTLDTTKKIVSSARPTVTLDSTKKTASSARPTVASDSTKKSASSAKPTVSSDSTKKSASSAIQSVTYRKYKVPKNASSTTKKLPGSISHTDENKGVVAMKTAIKGRKLFDEASQSATKAEKEISIAHVTKASEPLLDNSTSKDGNNVQVVNPRVYMEISIANVTNASEPLLDHDDSSFNASSEVELDPIVEKGISEDKEDIYTSNVINYSEDLSIADEGHNMNKENNSFMENGEFSPPISSQLRELQSLVSSTPLCMELPEKGCISLDDDQISTKIAESTNIVEPRTPDIEKRDVMNTKSPWETFNVHGPGMENSTEIKEPRTPDTERRDVLNAKSPWETFNIHGSGMKHSLVKDYLRILNTAEKDELKKLKGIGEKRATYILELREESPEPFKSLDDLMDIGLSAKQIKGILKKEVGELFN